MNTELLVELIESPKLSALVRILCILVVLLVVFWAGTAVGYRTVGSGHGATGQVIKVDFPVFVISERSGREKTIIVTQETILRRARLAVASTSVAKDDYAVVIGHPDGSGRIAARFVRFMPHTTIDP